MRPDGSSQVIKCYKGTGEEATRQGARCGVWSIPALALSAQGTAGTVGQPKGSREQGLSMCSVRK